MRLPAIATKFSLEAWLHRLSYAIAPGRCLLCNSRSRRKLDLCPDCEKDLPVLSGGCPSCAEPDHDNICPQCLKNPPPYSAALCGFRYSFPVDQLIHKFKNQGISVAGYVLTMLACQQLHRELTLALAEKPLITSIPLHPNKQRTRGFNQSEMIANWLANTLSVPKNHKLLSRTRETPSQQTLNAKEREQNLKGAFQLHDADAVVGRSVLLVDDVVTTGSTVAASSRLLMQAGAEDVVVFAIARTPSS